MAILECINWKLGVIMDSKFYVSREAAMLLREKGYDIKRDFLTPVYNENGCLYWSNHEDLSDKIPAITKDEAIDWLESKGIVIELLYTSFEQGWFYDVFVLRNREHYTSNDYKTRLEAKDVAIVKAIELL